MHEMFINNTENILFTFSEIHTYPHGNNYYCEFILNISFLQILPELQKIIKFRNLIQT